jgi:long-chain fatty acid transport protein
VNPVTRLAGSGTALFASIVASSIPSAAEGFRNPPPGAFDLGRAGGRFAHVDDASAVTHNPANLVDITEPELQLGVTGVYYQVDFTSPSGATDTSKNPWHALPNLFAAFPLDPDGLVLGLGITMPYGLASEWEQPVTSPFYFTAPYKTELLTVNLNPSVAVRLTHGLTLGAGFDVMWSNLELSQRYPPQVVLPVLRPGDEFKLSGDGTGFGANVGVTWEFLSRHRLSATFRSPITVEYDGTTEISALDPAYINAGFAPQSHFGTEIKFPTIVGVGYGVELSDRLRLEVNGEWLQFSNFDKLRVDAGNNAVLLPATEVPQDWNDTFTVGVAGDWRVTEHWILRAGYQFYESPVPDETLSPAIPDANQNVVTVGVAWRHGGHALEAAYAYDWYDRREITNNQNPFFNGIYDITVHMLAFTYRLRF